jgi:hypothetical protein
MEGGAVGHNFEMGLPKDYPSRGNNNRALQKLSPQGKKQ